MKRNGEKKSNERIKTILELKEINSKQVFFKLELFASIISYAWLCY